MKRKLLLITISFLFVFIFPFNVSQKQVWAQSVISCEYDPFIGYWCRNAEFEPFTTREGKCYCENVASIPRCEYGGIIGYWCNDAEREPFNSASGNCYCKDIDTLGECEYNGTIGYWCTDSNAEPKVSTEGNCRCEARQITGPTIPVYDPGCTPGDTENVKTALGCLPTDPETFINKALPWTIGVGAGIAFLLGVFGAAMIILSAGNPEKMQAGKEMITSAIAGLFLIIFAVLILNVVGVKVLNLFDFQEPPHPGGGGR